MTEQMMTASQGGASQPILDAFEASLMSLEEDSAGLSTAVTACGAEGATTERTDAVLKLQNIVNTALDQMTTALGAIPAV